MRAVVQRVSRAEVIVKGESVGAIGRGLLILLGIAHDDGPRDIEYLAEKILTLRICEDAAGRMCLCNGLMANIGLGQVRAGRHHEPGLITAGDDVGTVKRFRKAGKTTYTAADVIQTLLNV